jgi:uncharacterized membrane protein
VTPRKWFIDGLVALSPVAVAIPALATLVKTAAVCLTMVVEGRLEELAGRVVRRREGAS